jgi:hypothetical protein
MYDSHLFHKYEGATVREVIRNWLRHISKPIPASVDGRDVDDLGPTALCPAIVLDGDTELRRVGEMVHPDFETRGPKSCRAVLAYWRALRADPDIPRLLAKQYSSPPSGEAEGEGVE